MSKATPEFITLKTICGELKLEPGDARQTLRAAAKDAKRFPELGKSRQPRSPWQWQSGSKALAEARVALAPRAPTQSNTVKAEVLRS